MPLLPQSCLCLQRSACVFVFVRPATLLVARVAQYNRCTKSRLDENWWTEDEPHNSWSPVEVGAHDGRAYRPDVCGAGWAGMLWEWMGFLPFQPTVCEAL